MIPQAYITEWSNNVLWQTDLVQIKAEPIKETIDKIREVLTFLGEPKVKQKENNNTLIFRFESEMAKTTTHKRLMNW